MSNTPDIPDDPDKLLESIRNRALALGFQQLGVADTDLHLAEERYNRWLALNHHGDMSYMSRHGNKRTRPELLVPGTIRVISVRMDYLADEHNPWSILNNPDLGYVSRYARGRDYHKLMRNRLQRLAQQIEQSVGRFGYRVFVDSAPVLEKPLAQKAGLGWQGKHSNLVSRDAGGWFFLGEIYTDLPLPTSNAAGDHCGRCRACIDICPTRAIIAPYQLDARRCISYLTIEHMGAIPESMRQAMGNRIYGCDDCLLVCPWNRFAEQSRELDFLPRQGLDAAPLMALFSWSEAQFLKRFEGSPIRRLGHVRWLRNIAVALGNGARSDAVLKLLESRRGHPDPLVGEHVTWAQSQLLKTQASPSQEPMESC